MSRTITYKIAMETSVNLITSKRDLKRVIYWYVGIMD
jgi:hypothetical protein